MSIDRTARLLNIAQTGDDPELRLEAIDQLGDAEYKGNTEVTSALVNIMQDRDDYAMAYKERRAALHALAKIGDTNAVQFITYALEDDSSPVKVAAANALGKLGSADSIQPLIAVTADDNDEVRQAAVMALGEIGEKYPVSVEVLIPLLADPKDEIRDIVRDVIEAMNPAGTLGFLMTALEEPNSTVRGAVAEILGELKDERARSALQRTYEDDKSEWVRGRAKWALDQLPPPQFPTIKRQKQKLAPSSPQNTLDIMRASKPQWPSLDGTPIKDIDDIQREKEEAARARKAQAQQAAQQPAKDSTSFEITREQIQGMLDQLDVRLASGEISEDTYPRLAQRWETRLKSLD